MQGERVSDPTGHSTLPLILQRDRVFPGLYLFRAGPGNPGLLPARIRPWEWVRIASEVNQALELSLNLFTFTFTWNAHGVRSDMWICLHACEFDHTVNAFLSLPSPTELVCVHENTHTHTLTHTHTHIHTYTYIHTPKQHWLSILQFSRVSPFS